MKITEIAVLLTPGQGALLATADLVIDSDFVVHNIRVIRISDRILISMPNRVTTARCLCGEKYPVSSRYCCGCGQPAPRPAVLKKVHSDVAHPLTAEARQQLDAAVLAAYQSVLSE
jgi:DNA-binding cell septation regulator SpoVG